jgi:gluconate 2-dehydrogenase gamma chain
MSPQESFPPEAESVALTYFNDFQARTVEAIAERIIPAGGSAAGATQAGVVYYIDRAISGFSTGLQRVYRLGLRELERLCTRKHTAQFVDLTAEQQDEIIRELLGDESVAVETRQGHTAVQMVAETAGQNGESLDLGVLRLLFAVIREHTVEGYFCDPVYGGNRGAVGWRLVGFPGVQWGYTEEQMKPGFDASRIPIKTLSDLRRDLTDLPDNAQFYINEGE